MVKLAKGERMKIPMSISIRKKALIKHAISGAVLVLGLVLYLYKIEGKWQLSDGLFLAGLAFLVIGCMNLVRWLGLFDFTVYGFKKLAHHWQATKKNAPPMDPMPSYVDYLKQPRVVPSAGEPLLVAIALIVLSLFAVAVGI